jgi:outer membrane protein insertion porin family
MNNIFLRLVLITTLFFGNALAETFSEFQISGNKRVSSKTIINFSKLEKNTELSKNDLNTALKNIYESNFFEEVSVNILNNKLLIKVKEYPIIQDIKFNGIKAKKHIELFKTVSTLQPKSSFNKFTLQDDVNKISNVLRKSGYYFSEVNVEQQVNSNNTIDLVYDIKMGNKAVINKISFIGDKKYKSRKLRNIIRSEEGKFWKFISQYKYLNKELTQLDKRLLKNFYLDNGYYQVEIEDAYSQILDEENFSLIYKINAGKKFSFNKFKILLPDDYDTKDFDKLRKTFSSLENETYSYRGIQAILDEIDKIAAIENYEFIDVSVDEIIKDGNKIDFVFKIKEGDRFYVETINILGNNITNEEFIRQQFIVDEGDPLNLLLHNKTVNRLKSTRIFKSVKSEIKESNTKGLKVIDITLEEKPTGEITAGAGYGTSGSTLAFGITENNFNGKGIRLDTNLQLTEESIRGKFSYTNPNFRYSDRKLTTTLESTVLDKEKTFGYKSSLNSFALGTSFEQYENLFFSPNLSIMHEELTTTPTASASYKKQEGSYFDTLFNYSLSYDKRDSVYRPKNGYISTIVQELPLISSNYSIINGYQITSYKEIVDQSVLSIGLYTRAINSLKSNQDVRVSKRMFLPKSKLRGFESGKIGPRDGKDFVGGNYMAAFNTSITLPYLFESFENIDFSLFYDAANVWHADYSRFVDQGNSIRSAAGVAVDVVTPIGPLSFSLTQPITKASGDVTESFRFNLGTTF